MRYEVIQTGSDGNATLVNGCILIDCGVAFKKLQIYEPDLRLVLLTHHHGDHFNPSTVHRLAKDRPTLRWGCCDWMVPFLLSSGVAPGNIDVFEIDPEVDYTYTTLGIRVRPERLIHNAENCGYHICDWSRDDWLFYATDTGSLDGIEAKGYNTYLVEANHTQAEIEARAEAKLEAGGFAYETAAMQNHLSYEQAVEWLQENMAEYSIWVPMHGHKEKEGNTHGGKTNAVPEGDEPR